MFQRRNISLTDHLWFPFLIIFILALAFEGTPATYSSPTGPMPDLKWYPVDQAQAFQGHLPCGDAYMEVRQGKGEVEWVVVWYLNDKVLAAVFVYQGYSQAFVDTDFDGKWNFVQITKRGEGSVLDIYRKVKGCEGLTL